MLAEGVPAAAQFRVPDRAAPSCCAEIVQSRIVEIPLLLRRCASFSTWIWCCQLFVAAGGAGQAVGQAADAVVQVAQLGLDLLLLLPQLLIGLLQGLGVLLDAGILAVLMGLGGGLFLVAGTEKLRLGGQRQAKRQRTGRQR